LSLAFLGRADRVKASRALSRERVIEGGEVELRVEVECPSRLFRFADRVPDGLELVGGDPGGMALSAGRAVYRVRAPRGVYVFWRVAVDVTDPLGLASVRVEAGDVSVLTSLPRPVEARPPRGALGGRPPTGDTAFRRAGIGEEFMEVRDYLPGDPLKRVNWKATARLGRLMSNEYEEQRSSDVLIVVDTSPWTAVGRGDTVLDHEARAALAMAEVMMASGRAVGLAAYGVGIVRPDRGANHLMKIADLLASLRPGNVRLSMVAGVLAGSGMERDCSIIVITPMGEPDSVRAVEMLARAGFRVSVLSPSPATAEAGEGGRVVEAAIRLAEVRRRWLLAEASRFADVVDWDVRRGVVWAVSAVC
ncbi:MAG: hypothetical protein DRO06_04650, partial [Thermoproteota archaeon]